MALSPATVAEIERQRARYPQAKSAILPCLWAVQHEFGWLAPDGMEELATLLGLAPSEVQAVATFYSMYFQRPGGRHLIQVCVNVACALRGADDVVGYLEEKLGCPSGGTTADGVFTWESTIECLGACGYAPMMQVDHRFYENLTEGRIDDILQELTTAPTSAHGDGPRALPAATPRATGAVPAVTGVVDTIPPSGLQTQAVAPGAEPHRPTGETPPSPEAEGPPSSTGTMPGRTRAKRVRRARPAPDDL